MLRRTLQKQTDRPRIVFVRLAELSSFAAQGEALTRKQTEVNLPR